MMTHQMFYLTPQRNPESAPHWFLLQRFCLIGSTDNTYTDEPRDLTRADADVFRACLADDTARAVDTIVTIRQSECAVTNTYAITALAYIVTKGDDAARRAALTQISRVCQSAADLSVWLEAMTHLRGNTAFGRVVRHAVATWYSEHPEIELSAPNQLFPPEAAPMPSADDREGWAALFNTQPLSVTLHQLPQMANVGLFNSGTPSADLMIARLNDVTYLRAENIHPLDVLAALKSYRTGRDGSLRWTPNPALNQVLAGDFERALINVATISLPLLIALDVSLSMKGHIVPPVPGLTALEAGAAMLYILGKTQPDARLIAFDTRVFPLTIAPDMRFDSFYTQLQRIGGGGTDAALPFDYAVEQEWEIGGFLTITDSENWCGKKPVIQALNGYRSTVGDAQYVNLQLNALAAQLYNPHDAAALEIAGFSPNVLTVAANFFNGDL